MSPTPRRDELLAIIRAHYPSGLSLVDPRHEASTETRRLRAAREAAARERTRLSELQEAIRARHPDLFYEDWTNLRHEACYLLRLTSAPADPTATRFAFVVGCISVIAPAYVVYVVDTRYVDDEPVSHVTYEPTEETAALFREMREEIERRFPGYAYVPPEIGLTIVPGVQVGLLDDGDATIYDCIFSSQRT